MTNKNYATLNKEERKQLWSNLWDKEIEKYEVELNQLKEIEIKTDEIMKEIRSTEYRIRRILPGLKERDLEAVNKGEL